MADRKLNELPIAQDGSYIYAEADGKQVKIAKADVASILSTIIQGKPTELAKLNFGASTLAELAARVNELNVQTSLALPSGGVYQSVQLWAGGPEFAKCNVGAKTESEYGDLFAWGATEPYRLDGSTVLDPTGTSGDVWAWYNKSAASKIQHDLYPNEDAAAVHMGKGWRMPTQAELNMLVAGASGDGQSANTLYVGTYCNHMWTQVNGVWGRKFIDKRDEANYLFFPAAGYVYGSSLYDRGGLVNVWSRSRNASTGGWKLYSSSGDLFVSGGYRYHGFSVRGVRVQ